MKTLLYRCCIMMVFFGFGAVAIDSCDANYGVQGDNVEYMQQYLIDHETGG